MPVENTIKIVYLAQQLERIDIQEAGGGVFFSTVLANAQGILEPDEPKNSHAVFLVGGTKRLDRLEDSRCSTNS